MVWPPGDQTSAKALWIGPVGVLVRASTIVLALHHITIVAILITAGSLVWFWRQSVFYLFLGGWSALGLFSSIIYAAPWHGGLIFLFWAYCIWIGFMSPERSTGLFWRRWGESVALTLLLSHIWYTGRAYLYDYTHPYSGSLAAAEFIKSRLRPGDRIFGDGFPTVALQPYFGSNLFANYHGGRPPAYWIWSPRNDMARGLRRFPDARPAMIVITVGSLGTAGSMAEAYAKAAESAPFGFHVAGAFEGHLTWFGSPFEEESYLVLEGSP